MSILKRQILYPGKKDLGELEPESKLIYHFETVIINNAEHSQKDEQKRLVIDDSRQMAKGEPVETIYGKQFKLPIWESCLSSMRKGEICKLTVRDDPVTHFICLNYVVTSKCFRKHYGIEPTNCDQKHKSDEMHQHDAMHNCSMSIRSSPYKDLNEMLQHPPEIFEFTFELVDVIPPESYTKDIWQMSDVEKVNILPKYREDGNRYYAGCEYENAVSSYSKGLSIIESLMVKERPQSDEWTKFDLMKIPFLLNLAQVKLVLGEYYECIKLTDEVLKKDPENIKALFRRAKAHAAVWNIADARKDFKKCLEYDRNMTKTITKCFQDLKNREIMKDLEDRKRFGKMFVKES